MQAFAQKKLEQLEAAMCVLSTAFDLIIWVRGLTGT